MNKALRNIIYKNFHSCLMLACANKFPTIIQDKKTYYQSSIYLIKTPAYLQILIEELGQVSRLAVFFWHVLLVVLFQQGESAV